MIFLVSPVDPTTVTYSAPGPWIRVASIPTRAFFLLNIGTIAAVFLFRGCRTPLPSRLAVGSYDLHVWRCAAAHLDGRTAAWPPRADHAAEFTLTFPSVAIFRVPTPDRSTRSSGQPCSTRRCMVHAVRGLKSPSHPSDHNVYGLIDPYISFSTLCRVLL